MNNKTKEAIRGHIKAIENALKEDEPIKYGLSDPILRYEDGAKPLEPADLRARASAGKTMYYEYDTPNGTLSGCVKTFHSQTTCDNLLRKRAVFIDGDKAYKEKVEKDAALKLRVGGKYLSRNGIHVEIIYNDNDSNYPFDADNGRCYMENGREWSDNTDSDDDLIKEL